MGLFDNITTQTWNLATKTGFTLSMFLLTLVFALLPLVVVKSYRTEQNPDKKTWYSRVIGILNCFAGGVFLGTALLHLLPQVVDMLSPVRDQTKFPLAEFTVALGFLVVMVVEQTAVACREQQVDTLNPVQRLCQPPLPIVDRSEIHTLTTDEIAQSPSPCLNMPAPIEQKPMSLLRSVLLLTVLSIHSMFEGLAIGLQTDIHSIVAIFAAVIVHKVIVAFSIGLSLLQSRLPLTSVFALDVLFSVMSPTGILIGLLIDKFHTGSRQQLFSGILQGISCGTFLYITCFEVLPRELNQGRDRLIKLMLLLIGFSSSVAAIFIEAS